MIIKLQVGNMASGFLVKIAQIFQCKYSAPSGDWLLSYKGTCFQLLTLCRSRKYPYPPQGCSLEILIEVEGDVKS